MTSTPAVPAAAVQEELRIDAEDGEAYSREEFIEAYGGTDEWDASEPAPQPGGSSVRSRSSSHSPSRDLGNRRTVVLERVVRSGHERDSKKVGRLKAGTVIEILETRKDPDGKQRVRFDQGAGGLAGWVSSSASGEGLAFGMSAYLACPCCKSPCSDHRKPAQRKRYTRRSSTTSRCGWRRRRAMASPGSTR